MAEPVTIKKYANRRLYNTGTSSYVTLEDLATMVKAGQDFVVFDAKTGEDITRSVLAQIIFEQENKEGQNLLPINFLRQLIRFYGDSMQMLVPRYLEASIELLTQRAGEVPPADFAGVRQRHIRDARPAGRSGAAEHGDVPARLHDVHAVREARGARPKPSGRRAAPGAASGTDEIDDLKRQMEEMQKRLDRLGNKDLGNKDNG